MNAAVINANNGNANGARGRYDQAAIASTIQIGHGKRRNGSGRPHT